MFGKKKNATAQAEGAPQAAAAVKKKKGGMSQVLHESVMETVLEKLRNNDHFIISQNGETRYVALLLDVSSIGGLDKKSRKDEAKGAIIEQLNSGKIESMITTQLMNDDQLILIPDAASLLAMDGFTLLTDAKYEFVYISDDGSFERSGKMTDYAAVSEFAASDDDDIYEFLDIEDDSVGAEYDEADADASEGESDDDIPDLPDDDDEIPDLDEAPADDSMGGDMDIPDEGAYGAGMQQDVPPSYDETGYGTDASYGEGYDAGAGQGGYADEGAEVLPEEEEEIPQDWVADAVTRKFYSDDLGLEITTEPFDAQFLHGNPYQPFDEDRPEGWINNHLNEMSREANLEMDRMHQNNLFLMRERYFKLISMHCDRIQKELNVNDIHTQYGQAFQRLTEARDTALQQIDQEVAVRKKEIEDAWMQKLREIGQDAARAAQHQYRERYGKQHDMDIYGIEDAVKASIEDEYQDSLHQMYDRRRDEASKLLDLGITEVLDEINDMYAAAMSDERVRYQELQENMRSFREDNRQNDIARSKALSDELAQSEKADMVLAEQTAKIAALTEEYNQKKVDLRDEIERLRAENERQVADLNRSADDRVAKVEAEKAALELRVNDLLQQYSTLDERKNKEYEDRMLAAKNEVAAWEDKCNHMMEVHKRSNLVSGFLVIAGLIAALAIGFIGGEYINVNNNAKRQQAQMIEDWERQHDDSSSGAAQSADANANENVNASDASPASE